MHDPYHARVEEGAEAALRLAPGPIGLARPGQRSVHGVGRLPLLARGLGGGAGRPLLEQPDHEGHRRRRAGEDEHAPQRLVRVRKRRTRRGQLVGVVPGGDPRRDEPVYEAAHEGRADDGQDQDGGGHGDLERGVRENFHERHDGYRQGWAKQPPRIVSVKPFSSD